VSFSYNNGTELAFCLYCLGVVKTFYLYLHYVNVSIRIGLAHHRQTSLMCLCSNTMRTKTSLSGSWKQLGWRSGCGQGRLGKYV